MKSQRIVTCESCGRKYDIFLCPTCNMEEADKKEEKATQEAKKDLIKKAQFIPLTDAKNIHYGHQNDTLEMAYLRGRNEIIELIKKEVEEK
jgi:hypothetical protein